MLYWSLQQGLYRIAGYNVICVDLEQTSKVGQLNFKKSANEKVAGRGNILGHMRPKKSAFGKAKMVENSCEWLIAA